MTQPIKLMRGDHVMAVAPVSKRDIAASVQGE